jgi:hypothetical protein
MRKNQIDALRLSHGLPVAANVCSQSEDAARDKATHILPMPRLGVPAAAVAISSFLGAHLARDASNEGTADTPSPICPIRLAGLARKRRCEHSKIRRPKRAGDRREAGLSSGRARRQKLRKRSLRIAH